MNDFFKFRENLRDNLCKAGSDLAKLLLLFMRLRSHTPEYVCVCCEGLFFFHSVKTFQPSEIRMKYSSTLFDAIFNCTSNYICKTCHKFVSKGDLPKLATSNGLKFMEIPNCLKELTALEERMVAPYINFMQIRSLKPYALNPQLSMKGSVVNIPVEINDMLSVLPRSFDDMATIQVKLKRHVLHKSDYMYETIRPSKVLKALAFLITTPLYVENAIEIDKRFIEQVSNNPDVIVDFIVDEKDRKCGTIGEICDKLKQGKCNSDVSIDQSQTDSSSDNNDTFPAEEINIKELNDEVLVIDNNMQMVNKVKVIAPGQNKHPVAWLSVPDIEELCFPKIFAGHRMVLKSAISYSDRVKSETRRRDRRSCAPTRLLFMAKKKLEICCLSNMNICLRKTKHTKDISAAKLKDSNFLDNLIKFDDGYRFLKQIRGSPAYWENRKKDLMATIRQLGKPTFFLTLSAGESLWPELIKTLMEVNENRQITLQEAFELDANKKTQLIRNDPVTCARYFDYKANKFIWLLKQKNSIFCEFSVVDSYERVEYQLRGSPHEHIFLWLENAPKYEPIKEQSIADCIDFVDRFITCELNEDDPYMTLQRHKHTFNCYIGRGKNKKEKKCRFNFPLPIMKQTTILTPLKEEDVTPELRRLLNKISDFLNDLFRNPKLITFEAMLKQMETNEELYLKALRLSLLRPQIFLKRTSLEVAINAYNKDILHMFESNIDLQLVLEEYGIASYIINYISKVDAGMSKLLRVTAHDANKGNINIKEKFRKITNAFLNSNLMSAQEAAYHVLSLPFSKNSRTVHYINTSPRAERVQILKSKQELEQLNDESNDVFKADFIEKYSKRSKKMENICLADFVAEYTFKPNNTNEDDDINGDFSRRQRLAIIRYRRYKFEQDERNYCREQVMLFLPWRHEERELEDVNIADIYEKNRDFIEKNREKYSIIEDESLLEQFLEKVQNEEVNDYNENLEDFIDEALSSPGQRVDILQQGGVSKNEDTKFNRFTSPQRIKETEMLEMLRKLNAKQREFVMHVLNQIKINISPLRIFLSGSAGVGKSTVINAIYQLITNYFDNLPGNNSDQIYVLLCAPSGKAAFLINGVTLHTAFALPIAQFGGQMPELSNDLTNTIREKLFNLKLLIIDEISMVGSTLFNRVDTRLRQIMGINESFGGVSVIVVGDLNQLPPVLDTPIYKMSKKSQMFMFFDTNPLWDEFKFYELTKIMRQKNDVKFIEALNNLALGKLTDDNVRLFQSRQIPNENDVPEEAIRLYFDNASVSSFNDEVIKNFPGKLYICEAKDYILGKVSENTKNKVLQSLKNKKISDTNGLPTAVKLKVGVKYMLTTNIDVEDGLVNGANGVLKSIQLKSNTDEPYRLWIDFSSERVGNKARSLLEFHMTAEKISNLWTPVDQSVVTLTITNKLQHQTIRKQFPVIPAQALTVHKSQGQTYEEICFDFRKAKRITQSLLYVALSRVTKLSGLYILGAFRYHKQSKDDSPALRELNVLKTKKRLALSFDTLKNDNRSVIQIIYQNIGSLKAKLPDIASDNWYSRADIVIFSETLTKETDCIEIENYDVAFQSNVQESRSRGIIVFLKRDPMSDVQVHIKKHVLDLSDCGSIELLHFEINENYHLITGYKSPKMSKSKFESNLKKIIATDVMENILILGDFNFDIYNDENESMFLNNLFLNKYGLRSLLPKQAITTSRGTQIDVIYSNAPFAVGGVYETYFSYHKPIFAKIYKNALETPDSEANHRSDNKIIAQNDFALIKDQRAEGFDSKIHSFPPVSLANKTSSYEIQQIEEISNPQIYLNDIHIRQFHDLLATNSNLKPQEVLLNQTPQFIQPVPCNTNHLQILYMGGIGPNEVGHWVCSYYDGKSIHIYDSLNTEHLDDEARVYLEKLFPYYNKDYVFPRVQHQTNVIDCGVFATAFATTILLKGNPSEVTYDINRMRQHLKQMLQAQKISEFPTI